MAYNKENYILISPVKNEEEFIKNVLDTIVMQELKPIEWIIIDDNSTDKTAEIILDYAKAHTFIRYKKNTTSLKRDFASKVNAIELGYKTIMNENYTYLGILDADITLNSDYYAGIIKNMNLEPKVGIAGGKVIDIVEGKEYPNPASPYSIKGAIQLFRRKCFEDIGGFLPLKYGGEDAIACYTARYNGWELKHYEKYIVYHHRLNGTAEDNSIQIKFKSGKAEYHMGYLPMFNLAKCINIIIKKPYIIGAVVKLLGYWYEKLTYHKIIVTKEIIEFLRIEQRRRIFSMISKNNLD